MWPTPHIVVQGKQAEVGGKDIVFIMNKISPNKMSYTVGPLCVCVCARVCTHARIHSYFTEYQWKTVKIFFYMYFSFSFGHFSGLQAKIIQCLLSTFCFKKPLSKNFFLSQYSFYESAFCFFGSFQMSHLHTVVSVHVVTVLGFLSIVTMCHFVVSCQFFGHEIFKMFVSKLN